MNKLCFRCKQIKSLDFFHRNRTTKDGLQTQCASCRSIEAKKRYNTTEAKEKQEGYKRYKLARCKDCGLKWKRLIQSFRMWKGRCRKCAMKEMTNRPEIIKAKSIRARNQVLKQGGIPNARHFTSEMVSGEKGCNWRGGITPEIIRIRTSAKYKLWRKAVFERDNYTCQICGKRGVKINADHVKRFRDYPELRFDVNNGQTLCDPCHRATPTYGRKPHKPNVLLNSNIETPSL